MHAWEISVKSVEGKKVISIKGHKYGDTGYSLPYSLSAIGYYSILSKPYNMHSQHIRMI